MIGSASRSRELFVEGNDDEHAIGQLLIRRGFGAGSATADQFAAWFERVFGVTFP